MMETERPIVHGTVYAYSGRGCRCLDCKEASRRYANAYRTTEKGSQAARRSAARNNFIRQEALAWVRATHPEVIVELENRWQEKTGQTTADMQ